MDRLADVKLVDAIGDTPLIEIASGVTQRARGVRLLAKLEGSNPGGSVKDRPARPMILRALKEKSPGVTIVGCQPTEGSSIPGIRRWPKEYLPKIFDPERVDRVIDVDQKDAEATARALAREEGVFAGVSSGGAVWAARV